MLDRTWKAALLAQSLVTPAAADSTPWYPLDGAIVFAAGGGSSSVLEGRIDAGYAFGAAREGRSLRVALGGQATIGAWCDGAPCLFRRTIERGGAVSLADLFPAARRGDGVSPGTHRVELALADVVERYDIVARCSRGHADTALKQIVTARSSAPRVSRRSPQPPDATESGCH